MAMEGSWTLIFEHDPVNVGAKISKNKKGYMAKEFITELK